MPLNTDLSVIVDVQPGERFSLPPELVDKLGPGRWTVIVRPTDTDRIRRHDAFLNGYAPEDEGLYDEVGG